ncbi:hypothetical protein GCM10023091_33160 [Ravibacter arvi]|uniref:Outer membrane receptor for ferrienterochelin and colicins n=1 Tax=Ravibacter arvi TaxID=2051041 RepID=A0ABP8M3M7_9BACT
MYRQAKYSPPKLSRLKRCLLFIPGVLFLVTGGPAGAQTGSIRGSVSLSDGSPAAFAAVVCNPGNATTLTDNQGEFVLTGLNTGLHYLSYQMLGHRSGGDSVLVVAGETSIAKAILSISARDLSEVVVTGQSEPTALKKSVYQVRTISSERIRLRGATNLQTVLNTELGIRLSNDMTLGTSDIQLLGMNGQSVKILLDGVPLLDRGEIRESLGQVDINTIDRIEIVEGPMSVIYGTDALAGVINLITKKNREDQHVSLTARLQEETVQREYHPLSGNGIHNQSINLALRKSAWEASGGATRNNFGGWQGDSAGRAKTWMPKEQWLFNASAGFRKNGFNLSHRFNGTDESLNKLGATRQIDNELVAADKKYLTYRWFHQLRSDFRPGNRLFINVSGAYTDYSRRTQSTVTNLTTGRTTLSVEPGSQDKSIFKSVFGRAIVNYKLSASVHMTGGLEYNFNKAAGERIQATPEIHDYAVFLAPEIRLVNDKINLIPGVRLIHNSIYNAPPAVPSLNAKWKLSGNLDLRIAYAKGFRAPTLRELFFWFYDASHSIKGNPNLKAESSNSVNGFLTYRVTSLKTAGLNFVLGAFYNHFKDRIAEAQDPSLPTDWSYFNLAKFKTTGANLNAAFNHKSLQTSLGFQWLGAYNQYAELSPESRQSFEWTPEINFNLTYTITPIKTGIHIAYKYTGAKPGHFLVSSDPVVVQKTSVSSYQIADLSLNKALGKLLVLNAGVRNLFNITQLADSTPTGGAHTGNGSVPMSYGRSYFCGLTFNWARGK